MIAHALRLGLMATLMLGACDAASDDRALISEARLLAVQASPPILAGPASRVELEALFVDADGYRRVNQLVSYRACSPWVFVSDPERDCPPGASLQLPEERVSVAALLEFYPPPSSQMPPEQEPAGEEEAACDRGPALEVAIVATTMVDDFELVTIKRIPIFMEALQRSNPRIASIELVEELANEGSQRDRRIAFSLDPASLDVLCDESLPRLEAIRVHLYASSGDLEPKSIDVVPTDEGDLEPGEFRWSGANAGAVLWLVAIDRDGGVGWRYRDDI